MFNPHTLVRALLLLIFGSYAARNAREPGFGAGVLLGLVFIAMVAFLFWIFAALFG